MIRRVAVTLPLAGLERPRQLDFISDVHCHTRHDLERFIAGTRPPGAETLLLGGDYVERRRLIKPFLEHLAGIYPKVFMVLGNNERRVRGRCLALARRTGITLLEDRVAEWDGVHLLGTRDPARDMPRLARLPPRPLLVLAHSPDVLLFLSPERPLSIIAGHTHGGQVRFPWLPWWWSHTRVGRYYGEGRSRRGSNELFVGRGIGCSILPIRNVPSEIYTVTLEPQ